MTHVARQIAPHADENVAHHVVKAFTLATCGAIEKYAFTTHLLARLLHQRNYTAVLR